MVGDVRMARAGAKTSVEVAPVGTTWSNGAVERAVHTAEQYLRTVNSQLGERYKVRIDIKHPTLTWLCERSTYILNCVEVAKDGKTAYER